jgi:AcrR family transcriptional regulator
MDGGCLLQPPDGRTIKPMTAHSQFATHDGRQADILNAARQAFVEKGFDGASMQDLARSVGMSVGNFYRYFPSKAAIIEAIIQKDMDEMQRDFGAIIASNDPFAELRRTIAKHLDERCAPAETQLWAETTAVALRKTEIGALVVAMECRVLNYLIQVIATGTGLDETEARLRFSGHASLIMLLVKGSSMCLHRRGQNADELNEMILQIVDRTLDDIAKSAAKG